jgi:hypothetical protein
MQENISRSLGQTQVGGNNSHQHRSDAAFVEGIALDNQYRPPKPGARALGVRKGSPPDFTSAHYQSSLGKEAHCICARAWSRSEDSSA